MVNIFFTLLLKFTAVFQHFDIVRYINRNSLIGDFYKKYLFHVLKSHNMLFSNHNRSKRYCYLLCKFISSKYLGSLCYFSSFRGGMAEIWWFHVPYVPSIKHTIWWSNLRRGMRREFSLQCFWYVEVFHICQSPWEGEVRKTRRRRKRIESYPVRDFSVLCKRYTPVVYMGLLIHSCLVKYFYFFSIELLYYKFESVSKLQTRLRKTRPFSSVDQIFHWPSTYRVAAIYPDHFQSLTPTLKNLIFC